MEEKQCPLCNKTTGHAHFSYDIADYINGIDAQLKVATRFLYEFRRFVQEGGDMTTLEMYRDVSETIEELEILMGREE